MAAMSILGQTSGVAISENACQDVFKKGVPTFALVLRKSTISKNI